MKARGPTPCSQGWGAPPYLVGPLVALQWPSSPICSLSLRKKIRSNLLGQNSTATRRNLGGTNLGLWRSCSAGETSLWEGEIIAIVITNAPLIGKGQSPSTSSSAPSHLKTLVHLLYPILVSKSDLDANRLLAVLITPCSWCSLVYLVEDHMFRSIMNINTPLIMNMNMICE